MPDEISDHERRKNGGLTTDQLEAIRDAVLASVYEEIGRSVVKKVLWALGAVLMALLSWLGANHISLK